MSLSPGDNPPARNRLEELGCEPQLRRRLKVWHVVGLAMADVSPTMAVLFLTAGVFFVGGTFAVGASLLLAVVVTLIALCLAELAAMYPVAGGMYSLVRYVLPGPVTWITMFNYLIQGIVIPASIALGVATFLQDLIPALDAIPTPALALLSLVLATAIALLTVEVGAWLTFVMVVVELVVLAIVTIAAFANPQRGVGEVVFEPVVLSGDAITAVTFGVMLATLAPAFNVINGYDATLGFSEEMIGGERSIPKAVVSAAVLASLFILVPLIAAVVAAPDLRAFFNAEAPIVYSVEQALGPGARYIVGFGAAVALFNAMLALLMYFGRGFYTTGRDGIWPPPISRVLARVNRFGVPAAGILALAVPAGVLIFLTALDFLIIFSGTVIAAVYFCIGLAAIWSRVGQRDEPRPYRMPLWPLPPIIVVVFTGIALALQEPRYLIAELVLAAIAVVFWAVSKTWAGAQKSTETPAEAER